MNKPNDAAEQLKNYANTYHASKNKVDAAFDETGIGHDVLERLGEAQKEIAEFCANLQRRANDQAIYNVIRNVPARIMRREEANGKAAIRSAIVGAIGALVHWDVIDALEIAADIAEDVNAHGEARAIREMASAESRKFSQLSA